MAVSSIPQIRDVLDPAVATYALDEVAELFGSSTTKVEQLIRDRKVLAVNRDGQARIPRVFIDTEGRKPTIIKHLSGLIVVLRDGGFTDEEALRWLFTPVEDLKMSPIEGLYSQRAREFIRRAQAQSF